MTEKKELTLYGRTTGDSEVGIFPITFKIHMGIKNYTGQMLSPENIIEIKPLLKFFYRFYDQGDVEIQLEDGKFPLTRYTSHTDDIETAKEEALNKHFNMYKIFLDHRCIEHICLPKNITEKEIKETLIKQGYDLVLERTRIERIKKKISEIY